MSQAVVKDRSVGVDVVYGWHGGGKWTFTNPIINVGAEFSLFDYTDRFVSMKSIVSW